MKSVLLIGQSNKMCIRDRKQLGDDVNMVIHDIFDATTINGELISKVDNKATAIKQVIDYLGIDKKDTIAFGDSMNDYEMINFVAVSYTHLYMFLLFLFSYRLLWGYLCV